MVADERVERLRAALEMADTGIDLMRQNLRRRRPDAAAADVEQLLVEWLNSRTADCPGPRRSFSLG